MMNNGTKTIRRIVSWFAVVARDRVSRGLRRRLVDIYRNLYIQNLERAKPVSLAAEEILEFAWDLVLACLRRTDRKFDGGQIDEILIFRFRILAISRQVGFCEHDARHGR